MLHGPSYKPRLQPPPRADEGLQGIYNYLRDLDQEVGTFFSSIVTDTIGMLGVKGLSSTGIPARNFVKQSLAIGGQTSASWIFTNMEMNASYLIFYSPSVSTGMNLIGQTRMTTAVSFNFQPAVPSGVLLDVLLLR